MRYGSTSRRFAAPLIAAALALAAVACGGGTDEEETAAGPTAETAAKVEVTAVDYSFKGIPTSVKAGSEIALRNDSKGEVHEIVAMKIAAGQTRPIDQILKLPDAERGDAASVVGVVVAMPGEPGFAPEGPVILPDPGRYAFVCFIPTGADPAAYRKAAQEAKDGPPQVPGGPPHFTKGMFAEVKVV